MTTIYVQSRDGHHSKLEAADGVSLMEALRDGGIDELLALCGGCCSCATCHIYLEDGNSEHVKPISEEEDALLDICDHRTQSSRLACQINLNVNVNQLHVTIAPDT